MLTNTNTTNTTTTNTTNTPSKYSFYIVTRFFFLAIEFSIRKKNYGKKKYVCIQCHCIVVDIVLDIVVVCTYYANDI